VGGFLLALLKDIPFLIDLAQKGFEPWKQVTLEALVTFLRQIL
jgi:hypothetical protein